MSFKVLLLDNVDEVCETVFQERGIDVTRNHNLSGEELYAQNCSACHQADGTGLQPAFPALAGSDVATGDIAAHLDVVLQGRDGTAMAGFSDRLKPEDIAAAVTYTRNAWGNDTGDVVQPATVTDRNRG